MCFSLWPWVAWSFTAVMSLYRATLILSFYVSSMLHRISVLELARVLSHVALRLRQNRGTYRSTRRMATFFFLFRRLGQDMYVSSSPCHPTAGSQRLNRQMRSFHGSLTAHEFFSCPSHQRRDRESFKHCKFTCSISMNNCRNSADFL